MLGFAILFSKILLRICLIRVIEMLEYMFEISSEANACEG
jgi:hypothetical protein